MPVFYKNNILLISTSKVMLPWLKAASTHVPMHSFMHPKWSCDLKKVLSFPGHYKLFPWGAKSVTKYFIGCETETWQSRRIHFCLINPFPYFMYWKAIVCLTTFGDTKRVISHRLMIFRTFMGLSRPESFSQRVTQLATSLIPHPCHSFL